MKIVSKLITASCALLLLVAASTASAQGRIATIDLKKVFDNYWKTRQADAALKGRAAELDKEHKDMVADFNKGKDDYRTLLAASSDMVLSEAERDRKKKDAEDKLRSLKDQEESIMKFESQARTSLDEQRRRMRDNILAEIRKVVDGKAKLSNYSMVLDSAAESMASSPVLLFTSGENDITEAVLSQLNSSAPPEISKPAETNAAPEQKKSEPQKK
jgi:outer membrane protein